MPVLQGNRWLDNAVIQTIVETLASQLDKRRPLRFLDRVAKVDALDDEIFGRWTGNVLAADVVADSQKAVVVSAGNLEVLTTTIPNIKLGWSIDQAMLNRMNAISERGATRMEVNAMYEFWNNLIANLMIGVRERQNALVCGMMLDSIVYDRWGVKITANYGAPSDLKITPAVPWTDAVNSKPLTDILTAKNNAVDKYGKTYDRMTLPRRNLDHLINSDEFKSRAAALYGFQIPAAAVNVGNRELMESFVGRLLDLEVDIDNATYKEQTAEGKQVTRRVLPFGKVILTRKDDDMDGTVMDLANAMVTEAMVAKMAGQAPEGLSGERFGPVGYWTLQEPNLNPPGVVAWCVARCFPRRKSKEATLVLTVE
jgi:hypothetical protein